MGATVIPNYPGPSNSTPVPQYGPYNVTIDVGALLALASRGDLNSTATPAADRQLTVAAQDSLLPIPFGTVRLPALLANVLTYNGNWVFWVIWGIGPVTDVSLLTMNDQALPAGVTATHYTGTTTQGVDATLAAAFAALGGYPAYAETLPGICYSVITAPAAALSGPPQFNLIVNGLALYDPRLDSTNGGSGSQRLATPSTWTFSRNPALMLAHVLRVYDGKTPDWPSVIAVANATETVVGSGPTAEVLRAADMVIDREASVENWIETLRTAAGCWVVPQGDVVKLIADVSASSSASYSHASGQVLGISGETMQATTGLPTVLEVVYTDISQLPWRDVQVLAKRPGVDSGATPWRKSTVRMPWITRSSQANREAIERLNKLWLRSVSMNVDVMDEGLKHEPGDVITVTYPDSGYSSLTLRVANVAPTADGWRLACVKEDAGAYSSIVQPGPTIPNTPISAPNSPPTPTGLAVAEDVYQVQTGLYGSRLRVTWTASTWPFLSGYLVTITQAGTVKDTQLVVGQTAYLSKDLTENLLYNVTVQIVSSTGAVGTAAATSITNSGKLAKPTDVPALTGFEVGGEVRLSWTSATDLDLTATELRYGAVGGSWATATLLDRVAAPAVRYSTKVVAPGTWVFYAKGLDSVRSVAYPFGQESVNAASCTITVTSDSSAFVASSTGFSSPSLTNMLAVPDFTTGGTGYVTDFGDTWNSLFTSNLSTYTNPLLSYHTAGTSGLVTEVVDIGAAITGDWSSTMTYVNIAGTATQAIELNTVGGEGATTITGATNATPIVLTITGHPYKVGDELVIAGVGGNTAANGRRTVTAVTTNTVTLADLLGKAVAGNGAYTSGGTASRWVWNSFSGTTAKAAGRYVRQRIQTTGALRVTALGAMQCNAVARRESALTTTSAAGPQNVLLTGLYQKLKSLLITPQSTSVISCTYDRVLINPTASGALQLQLNVDGPTGNCYAYWKFSTNARVIAAGDYLEYDVLIPANSILAYGLGGIEIDFADATTGRGLGIVDQDGAVTSSPDLRTKANGVWYHRKMSLAAAVGKTVSFWSLVCESDTLGFHVMLAKNILVTDGAGSTRLSLYGTSGLPTANAAGYSLQTSAIQLNPANSLDVYAFDNSGTKQAVPVSVQLEGV